MQWALSVYDVFFPVSYVPQLLIVAEVDPKLMYDLAFFLCREDEALGVCLFIDLIECGVGRFIQLEFYDVEVLSCVEHAVYAP